MATTSEIETGLAEISAIISTQRAIAKKAIQNAGLASAALAAIPTDYAGVIAAVQAYGTSNAYEATVKALFDKLTTEFLALKGITDSMAAVEV